MFKFKNDERGFSLLEMLVSVVVLLLIMAGVASLLIHNARINKAQQMTAEIQSSARNSLELIVQVLRSAGWDPGNQGINIVGLDPNLGDNVSQIEVFIDLDGDGLTDQDDEQILIRHNNGQIEWRRNATGAFAVLSNNISNDADGDGTLEPMFVPDDTVNPTMITVQITAQSRDPDPTSRDFIRYTVRSDVVLRKEL